MNTIILNDIDLENLLKAQKRFKEYLKNAKDDLDKTGVIKAFEYCYESSWKILKRVIQKITPNTIKYSRDVFRQAAVEGLIDNPQIWFDFVDLRNETVHTYNDEILEKIYSHMPLFEKELDSLTERLLKLK